MTCDLLTVFHSAGPAALSDSPDPPQRSFSCLSLLFTSFNPLSFIKPQVVSVFSTEGINILSGLTCNSLIHSLSFNASVKQAHRVCYLLFAEKVKRRFVCLIAFAGSSECKDMDQS